MASRGLPLRAGASGRARRAGAAYGLRPQRLHIVGGPGTRKTTLARRLSARLAVPAYDLDTVAFAGDARQALEVRRPGTGALSPDDEGAITRAATALWLEPYATRVLHCRTATDLDRLMSAVDDQAPAHVQVE